MELHDVLSKFFESVDVGFDPFDLGFVAATKQPSKQKRERHQLQLLLQIFQRRDDGGKSEAIEGEGGKR